MKNVSNKNITEKDLETLVSENSALIWSIVKRFKNRGYELDDLFQIGAIGFIKAVKRFDRSFDTKLSTYAVPYIIGEIKIFLRDDGMIKVSRGLKELNHKIKILEEKYEKNNEIIQMDKIIKELKISKEDYILAQNINSSIESINEYCFDNSTKEKEEKIIVEKNENPENNILQKIMIKDALKKLDEKEKNIILLRYFKEKTQSEVAKIYGISQVQVSRLEKKILQKMREDIKEII